MNILKLFINNVETLTAAKGWGRSDLARAIERTPQQVYNILSGKSSPNYDTMAAIANALDVPLWKLIKTAGENGKTSAQTTLMAESISKDPELMEIVKALAGSSAKSKDLKRLVLSIIKMPSSLFPHASNAVFGLLRGYNESL